MMQELGELMEAAWGLSASEEAECRLVEHRCTIFLLVIGSGERCNTVVDVVKGITDGAPPHSWYALHCRTHRWVQFSDTAPTGNEIL